VTPDRRGAAPGSTDRVQLVDEDDGRGDLLGLLEQVTYPAGPNPDDHLDELGRRHREERHVRLARDRPSQQRLAEQVVVGERRPLRGEPVDLRRVPCYPAGRTRSS
jgi:hypothetical protein